MLLAQITDLHMRRDDTPLSGQLVTRPLIAAAIDAVNGWGPDAVIVTGDLTDIGSDDEYGLVRAELDRLHAPYHVLPGNHDRHGHLRAAFADHSYLPTDGPMNWVIDSYPLRLIGLDTVVPGKGHGHLTDETLAWLDGHLATSPRPTLIALHHPPFPTGILGMDKIMCLNGAALGRVIAPYDHVERVVAGHHHRPVQIAWAGTLGQIAPSVAHQVALDFRNRDRPEWVLEPPAFLLHRWDAGTGLITHTAYVNDYGSPRPFRLDPDYPGAA